MKKMINFDVGKKPPKDERFYEIGYQKRFTFHFRIDSSMSVGRPEHLIRGHHRPFKSNPVKK